MAVFIALCQNRNIQARFGGAYIIYIATAADVSELEVMENNTKSTLEEPLTKAQPVMSLDFQSLYKLQLD